jgi:predicted ferric reductase
VLSSRIRIFEKDIGLDRLFIAHRYVGITGLSFVLIHAVARTIFELIRRGAIQVSFGKALGIAAFLLFLLIATVAMFYKAFGMKYEVWKNMHRAAYFIFPLAFSHAFVVGGSTLLSSTVVRVYLFVLIGVYALIVATKAIKMIQVRRHPFTVAEVVPETHDTWTLRFDGPKPDFKPGQFMLVNLVRGGEVSEAHPYTISSSPAEDKLAISPKAIGDFSASVKDTKVGDKAYIEAPYGVFSYKEVEGRKLVFVAGGIGITPFMSMLRYMRDTRDELGEVTLIWGNKTERDIAFRDELSALEHELSALRVVHVMSGQEDWEGETGYITPELVRKYSGSLEDREIFICGPPIMREKLTKALRADGVPQSRLHYEIFAL